MTYRVRIAPDVSNAIMDQAMFVASDSVDRTLAWEAVMRKRIEDLSNMPTAYPVGEDESLRLGYEVRKLNVGDFLVFFRVIETTKEVVVVGLRHGAMLPPTD